MSLKDIREESMLTDFEKGMLFSESVERYYLKRVAWWRAKAEKWQRLAEERTPFPGGPSNE